MFPSSYNRCIQAWIPLKATDDFRLMLRRIVHLLSFFAVSRPTLHRAGLSSKVTR